MDTMSLSQIEIQQDRNINIGSQKRTFLHEIRLQPVTPKPIAANTKDKAFWQQVIDKTKLLTRLSSSANKTETCLTLGGWINLPYGLEITISLVIEYLDGDEFCTLKIDSCETKRAIQIWLSGSCDIYSDNAIDSVKLYCYGIENNSIWIDNLRVEFNSTP